MKCWIVKADDRWMADSDEYVFEINMAKPFFSIGAVEKFIDYHGIKDVEILMADIRIGHY